MCGPCLRRGRSRVSAYRAGQDEMADNDRPRRRPCPSCSALLYKELGKLKGGAVEIKCRRCREIVTIDYRLPRKED
jgi:phage FluMu protein Com